MIRAFFFDSPRRRRLEKKREASTSPSMGGVEAA